MKTLAAARRLRVGVAAAAALAMAAALAVTAGLPAASRAAALPAGSALNWTACGHAIPSPFQCATVPVPLNYQQPTGAQLQRALLRLPASDPQARIGSLFIDFGGPGGPDVTDLVNRAYTVFSADVRKHFDLVTW